MKLNLNLILYFQSNISFFFLVESYKHTLILLDELLLDDVVSIRLVDIFPDVVVDFFSNNDGDGAVVITI